MADHPPPEIQSCPYCDGEGWERRVIRNRYGAPIGQDRSPCVDTGRQEIANG
jgi:hypothetical protein